MKKNGYVLYETLLSLTFCFIIIISMFNMILSLSNKLNDIYIMNKIESNLEILQKQIYDDLELRPCTFTKNDDGSILINNSNNSNKIITINNIEENNKKILSYGDYKFKFSNIVNIEISDINNTQYNDSDKGIISFNINVEYKEKNNSIDIYYIY